MTQSQLKDITLLTLAHEQVAVESTEETVILDPVSGRYFSLDGVGGDAWQLLQEPRNFAELRTLLLARYDVPTEVLESDLRELLSGLIMSGLVIAHND